MFARGDFSVETYFASCWTCILTGRKFGSRNDNGVYLTAKSLPITGVCFGHSETGGTLPEAFGYCVVLHSGLKSRRCFVGSFCLVTQYECTDQVPPGCCKLRTDCVNIFIQAFRLRNSSLVGTQPCRIHSHSCVFP